VTTLSCETVNSQAALVFAFLIRFVHSSLVFSDAVAFIPVLVLPPKTFSSGIYAWPFVEILEGRRNALHQSAVPLIYSNLLLFGFSQGCTVGFCPCEQGDAGFRFRVRKKGFCNLPILSIYG
jgi:hypothetical protein